MFLVLFDHCHLLPSANFPLYIRDIPGGRGQKIGDGYRELGECVSCIELVVVMDQHIIRRRTTHPNTF